VVIQIWWLSAGEIESAKEESAKADDDAAVANSALRCKLVGLDYFITTKVGLGRPRVVCNNRSGYSSEAGLARRATRNQ
jgi:hypothetical protein